MTNLELLRRTLGAAQVMTLQELHEAAQRIVGRPVSTQHLHTVYLKRLHEQGWVAQPRQGLFVATNPDSGRTVVDPYLIGAKLRARAFLGFHTALELHGSAYSDSATKYICLHPRDKFRPFSFQGTRYKPVLTRHLDPLLMPGSHRTPPSEDVPATIQQIQRGNQTVRVSTPSRTLVDCVARPQLAGGWETCLKSLAMMSGTHPEHVEHILQWVGNRSLWAKVGFVIELLREHTPYYSEFTHGHLERMHQQVPRYPGYVDHDAGGERHSKWNIYVPPRFEDYLEGV